MAEVEYENKQQNEPLEQLRREEETELYEYIQGFGARGPISVRLIRKSPMSYRGVKTNGSIAKYDHAVSLDQIAEEHGGGKYEIQIEGMRKDKKSGKMRMGYVGGRTFDVAGAPKLANLLSLEDDRFDEEDRRRGGNGESDGAVGQALTMAQRLADARERELQDMRREMRSSGMDTATIEALMAPMRDQLHALSESKADLEARMFEILNRPKDNASEERWLKVFENKEGSHANNLEAVRQQYEARISKLQDYHQEEVKRYEDRFERELQSVRAGAEREIQSIKIAGQQALDSQKHGYEMRIDGLKDIQKRLEREIAKLEAELVALRAKKEQGPMEQIQGLVGLKQGFDALMPSGGDATDKAGWERALDMLVNSPMARGVVDRISAGGGEEEEEQPQQLVPVQLPDGRVVNVPPHVVERMRQEQAQQAARRQELGADIPEISASDMAKAITFMESAYRNNTDPAMFAASARNMLPEDILVALRAVGVDAFLNKVAKIQGSSPLATIPGRSWVRQVAEVLLGGTGESAEVEPEPEPEPEPEDDDAL